ncbi:MAG: hypothetical protein A3J74_05750 [Elusimicrobia bacterium RIFCSPHIGHO2_02_FULL_57_9]|nr:MAG: hypothetical protein A3J74_05750 [Elusimicrobia bacterium RIFCSPHIGHO2_02_FULL_57_9]
MRSQRYESIDQFRGFAILSMVLVNVLGRFAVMPETFRHARFESLSFADSVAPFFFFIVGVGFRLAFLRNQTESGTASALALMFKRCLLLMLIGVFVYHFNARRIFWDALTQIGFGGIIALPVIGAENIFYRAVWPLIYAALLLFIGNIRFHGAPLEIESATWPLLILMGSLAADWIKDSRRNFTSKSSVSGTAILICGLIVYWLVPGVVAACALVYLGLSFLLFVVFYYLTDVWKRPLPHLTTLGRNALIVYILHYYIEDDMRKLIPDNAGFSAAVLAFSVVYVGCYATAKYLETRKYFITV